MQATPKRGRRLGGSSSHQKAMMGNLVASLIAAESIGMTPMVDDRLFLSAEA